jgi:hypothetical protein
MVPFWPQLDDGSLFAGELAVVKYVGHGVFF